MRSATSSWAETGWDLIERQVPMGQVQSDDRRCRDVCADRRSDFAALPVFKRDDYVTTHEVEIANLDDQDPRDSWRSAGAVP